MSESTFQTAFQAGLMLLGANMLIKGLTNKKLKMDMIPVEMNHLNSELIPELNPELNPEFNPELGMDPMDVAINGMENQHTFPVPDSTLNPTDLINMETQLANAEDLSHNRFGGKGHIGATLSKGAGGMYRDEHMDQLLLDTHADHDKTLSQVYNEINASNNCLSPFSRADFGTQISNPGSYFNAIYPNGPHHPYDNPKLNLDPKLTGKRGGPAPFDGRKQQKYRVDNYIFQSGNDPNFPKKRSIIDELNRQSIDNMLNADPIGVVANDQDNLGYASF